VEKLNPIPVSSSPGKGVAFSWTSSFISKLHQSGNATLAKVGQDLGIAAKQDDPRLANTMIAQAKSVCRSLPQ
jgi:hypothetical protein